MDSYKKAHAECARGEDFDSPESRFAGQAIDVLDQERERVAHDLHDAVGNELIIALIHIQACIPKSIDIEQGLSPDHVATLAAQLHRAKGQLERASSSLRQIVHGIGTETIGAAGVVLAVRGLLRKTLLPGSAVTGCVNEEGNFPSLPALEQVKLFRFVEGALSNITKHSRATAVSITFLASPTGYAVSVEDDGCGFDVEAFAHSFGLSSLRARARALGGQCVIQSSAGVGTRVMLSVRFSAAGERHS